MEGPRRPLSTAVLSLDTTAVLLTPVVLTLATQLGLDRAMFAYTTVWLANTASQVLPVSNLTNLLALHVLRLDAPVFAQLMWPAATASILVTVAALADVTTTSTVAELVLVLGELLSRAAGTGTGWPDLLRLAGIATLGANAVDNLLTYLAMEPVAAGNPLRMAALLIGVNAGPLVTPLGQPRHLALG